MQSIASSHQNLSRDETIKKLFSFILLLPQKWKKMIKFSKKSSEKILIADIDKYSQILEKLFALPSDSFNFFYYVDLVSSSNPDLINEDTSSDSILSLNFSNPTKDFIQNLLYLSNYQSIYSFLLRLVSYKSTESISFFENNDFTDLLLDFLFQEETFTNKKLFNQTIRLINHLIFNVQSDSPLITCFFKTYNSSKYQYDLFFDSITNNRNFRNNLLRTLSLSLSNDSQCGISFILSLHSRLSKSSNISLQSINNSEIIEKLYHFLGQKIDNKQFDNTTVSTILLLTSIMNDIFCHKSNLLKSDSEVSNTGIKTNSPKDTISEKIDNNEFFSTTLDELQCLYQYEERTADSLSEVASIKCQGKNNKYSTEIFPSEMPAHIYKDNDLNSPIKPKQNNFSSLSPHKNKCNSKFFPTMNKSSKDFQKSFSKLAQYEPNCISLGAIQEEKLITPLFPTAYKTYQQFELSNRIESSETDSNTSNLMSNEEETDSKSDHKLNNSKKRISHTNLKDKDIVEMVNSASSTTNIELNEIRTKKRTPLIPAIPTKPNSSKPPGRLRSLGSLNNIFTPSPLNTYELVESDSNSGYSSNYYKASISSSRSFGNILQTNNKNNFTVTTGLGTNNRNDAQKINRYQKYNNFGMNKRNSYSFVSPLKPLFDNSQSDIISSNDNFGNNSQFVQSSSQYGDDVFPTTMIESVIPQYAKEIHFCKNSTSQTQTSVQAQEKQNKQELNNNEEEEEEKNQIEMYNDTHQAGSSDRKQLKVQDESNNASSQFNSIDDINIAKNLQSSDQNGNKSNNIEKIDSFPKLVDNKVISPTPRGKKRSNSGEYVLYKNKKKVRTSLPPSGLKFNLQKNDNEISLIDLATSSEALNLDDFNIEYNRRMSAFSLHKNGLAHSTSGPIYRMNMKEFISPFRNPISNIDPISSNNQQQKSLDDKFEANPNNNESSLELPRLGVTEEIAGVKPPPIGLPPIKENNQQSQSIELKLDPMNEGTNQQQPSILEAINEEEDGSKMEPIKEDEQDYSMMEVINEETGEDQQRLEAISEGCYQNNYNNSQLETISEGCYQNNYNNSQLETISEGCYQNNYNNSQLGTINEDAYPYSPSMLGTISEELDENQQHQSLLETITEDEEMQRPSFLGTINEEIDDQQVSPLLVEINEDGEEFQQQPSVFDAISEEVDPNCQYVPSDLDTISEEADEYQSPLEVISEEPDEIGQPTPKFILDTIAEEKEEEEEEDDEEEEEEDDDEEEEEEDDDEEEEDENQEENHQSPQRYSFKLSSINEEAEELQQKPSLLETVNENEEELKQQQKEHPTTLESESGNPDQIQPNHSPSLESANEEVKTSTTQPTNLIRSSSPKQSESNLFVSVGVLLANELFIEDSSRFFQNSICLYLSNLNKCTGHFDKVVMESNLVMRILNFEKEGRIRDGSEASNEESKDDDADADFCFDYYESVKSEDGNIPMISKIINDNHDSIPLQFKSEWNEYMKSVSKKEE